MNITFPLEAFESVVRALTDGPEGLFALLSLAVIPENRAPMLASPDLLLALRDAAETHWLSGLAFRVLSALAVRNGERMFSEPGLVECAVFAAPRYAEAFSFLSVCVFDTPTLALDPRLEPLFCMSPTEAWLDFMVNASIGYPDVRLIPICVECSDHPDAIYILTNLSSRIPHAMKTEAVMGAAETAIASDTPHVKECGLELIANLMPGLPLGAHLRAKIEAAALYGETDEIRAAAGRVVAKLT